MGSEAQPKSMLGMTVGIGLGQVLGWGTSYYLPAAIASEVARSLDASYDTVFGAFSFGLLIAAAAGPRVGRWIDEKGGRRALCLSNLVFASGLALLGGTSGFLMLYFAWALMGLGMALGLYEAAFSTLTRLFGARARGAITGVTLFGGLSSTVFWPLSALMIESVGWRTTCFIWAGLHATFGLALHWYVLRREAVAAAPQQEDAQADAAPARAPFAMALLSVVFAITWFISTAMAAHLPQLLQGTGMSVAAALTCAAMVGPAQVAGRLLEVTLYKRWSPLVSAKMAAVAHPAGAIALISMGSPMAAAFALLHGAGNGILTVANGTLPLHVFGPNQYGRTVGLLMLPARLAQAVAPFAFALLVSRLGSAALLVTAALSCVSLGALVALGRYQAARSENAVA